MQRSQSSYHHHQQDHRDHNHTHNPHAYTSPRHTAPVHHHSSHSCLDKDRAHPYHHAPLNNQSRLSSISNPSHLTSSEKMFWTAQSTIEETFCAYTDIAPPSARRDEERRASSRIDSEGEKDVASIRTWAREERESGRKSRQSLPGPGSGVGSRGQKGGVVKKGQDLMATGSGVGAGTAGSNTVKPTGRVRVGHSFSVGAPAIGSGFLPGVEGASGKEEKPKR